MLTDRELKLWQALEQTRQLLINGKGKEEIIDDVLWPAIYGDDDLLAEIRDIPYDTGTTADEEAGIKPAAGMKNDILNALSEQAYQLIKIIELERSGIRDGDGYWHGSDPIDATLQTIGDLAQQWQQHQTYIEDCAGNVWHSRSEVEAYVREAER